MDCIFAMDDEISLNVLNASNASNALNALNASTTPRVNPGVTLFNNYISERQKRPIDCYELETFSRVQIRSRILICIALLKVRHFTNAYKTLNNTLCNMKESAHLDLNLEEIEHTITILKRAIMLMFYSDHVEVRKLVSNLAKYLKY